MSCEKCGNTGYVYEERDGTQWAKKCECYEKRIIMAKAKRSGLLEIILKCNFENFNASDIWQVELEQKAKDFSGDWFFVGGQSGTGKTHICTAMIGQLLKSGKDCVYMSWSESTKKLKALLNSIEYFGEIDKYKNAEVLYIDDFFKVRNADVCKISDADVNIAFEILNHRYMKKLTTIISSEFHGKEILQIDEATGGRIIEMCKDNFINISREVNKNYRIKE